jgi:hypothetical protein
VSTTCLISRALNINSWYFPRLYMKGARILDFERLREIVGDYQHLQYAKGSSAT